jgi:hypothetical protein
LVGTIAPRPCPEPVLDKGPYFQTPRRTVPHVDSPQPHGGFQPSMPALSPSWSMILSVSGMQGQTILYFFLASSSPASPWGVAAEAAHVRQHAEARYLQTRRSAQARDKRRTTLVVARPFLIAVSNGARPDVHSRMRAEHSVDLRHFLFMREKALASSARLTDFPLGRPCSVMRALHPRGSTISTC